MDERRDDWRRGVDENLASLNTGQRVNDRLIEDLDIAVKQVADLLHGTDTGGIIGRLEAIEHTVAELRAIIIMDASGKRGLQYDVQQMREGREDRRSGWGNLTKIAVAAIMSGLIGHFWHDIAGWLDKKPTDPVDLMIENAKHPKPKHRHYVIREDQEGETTEN